MGDRDISLLERFLSTENFLHAFAKVTAKGSKGGVDGVSIERFRVRLRENIARLQREIRTGRYVPAPVRSVWIPKDNAEGKFRELGLPTVSDKVAQAALLLVVQPLAEKIFHETSYGYRPGKGPRKAIRRVEKEIGNLKRTWASSKDIVRFYDSLDHDLLIEKFAALVGGEPVMTELVSLWCKMGIVDGNGRWKTVQAGVRQGQVIAPLLANLYLHPLDCYVAHELKVGWVRYADDFIILGRDRKETEEADKMVVAFLKKEAGLEVHDDMEEVRSLTQGFEFLGVLFKGSERLISPNKLISMKKKISGLLSPSRPVVAPAVILSSIGSAVDGWRRYYGYLRSDKQFTEMDAHIEEALGRLITFRVSDSRWKKRPPEDLMLPKLSKEVPAVPVSTVWKIDRSGPVPRNPGANTQAVSRKISRRRRRQARESISRSNLVVDTPGSFVGIRGRTVVVKRERRVVSEIRIEGLESIMIGGWNVSLSSALVGFCQNHGIPLLFGDGLGRVISYLTSPDAARNVTALHQLRNVDTAAGRALACGFVIGKVKNQFALLKYFHKYPGHCGNGFEELFRISSRKMREITRSLMDFSNNGDRDAFETFRQRLMGFEGAFGALYWKSMAKLLDERAGFPGRRKREPSDVVNNALNYGYGILYGKVLGAVVRCGLEPMIGFLHGCEENRQNLVCDLIEEFRAPVVDRAVWALVHQRPAIGQDAGGRLPTDGRKLVVTRVLRRLASEVPYGGQILSLEQVIQKQALAVRTHLEGKGRYRPFLSRW